ncbi:hypothetical protein BpHYR1_023696 [Brachionus plicatilis]|uniref:Uncharacterized protein n=1 Tax=Brachionus plicatilis TaxID=10195 RepID=A0A3M7QDT7_BRAPC|nr:hypothetical protein BpHYR1_023696 [Brachionus plicatilis]
MTPAYIKASVISIVPLKYRKIIEINNGWIIFIISLKLEFSSVIFSASSSYTGLYKSDNCSCFLRPSFSRGFIQLNVSLEKNPVSAEKGQALCESRVTIRPEIDTKSKILRHSRDNFFSIQANVLNR